MPRQPLIELRDAEVVRSGRTILHVDALAFNEGEHVAVLGPNGAGKSTLIALVTRDARPLAREKPSVLLRGQPAGTCSRRGGSSGWYPMPSRTPTAAM